MTLFFVLQTQVCRLKFYKASSHVRSKMICQGLSKYKLPYTNRLYYKFNQNLPFRLQYQNPHLAFKDFAAMFKELAIPGNAVFTSKTIHLLLRGNQRKYPPEMFHISDLVDFGTLYMGWKRIIKERWRKLSKNNSVLDRVPDCFQEMVVHKSVMHPVNLDEGESMWDRPRGMESPSLLTERSVLFLNNVAIIREQWNWRTATVIASGDYRGALSFDQVLPGDKSWYWKRWIVVHFLV